MVVIDAALLFESDLHRLMHENILVRTDPNVQMKRLIERDKFSEIQAWQRVLSQMPTSEKQRKADFVIDNSGTLAETRHQIRKILKKLLRPLL